MSEVIKIKKGLDIRLAGKAEKVFGKTALPRLFAVKPIDFHGVVPKMVLKEGAPVKAGTVLFYDKKQPDVKFVSPVSGTLKSINRGERRRILEVIVESDGKDEFVDYGSVNLKELNRESVVERLLESGAWPYIRQRPYDVIANSADKPKAIFISGFDSSPLAPDLEFLLTGKEEAFKDGIEVLKKLSPEIHIGTNSETASKIYNNVKGVKTHKFKGPHPAGNVGIQIHHIMPINKGEVIWVVQPQEVLSIGALFTQGKHDFSRVIALTGSEVKTRSYLRYRLGASVSEMLKDNLNSDTNLRVISGNVLTGDHIESDGFVGFYHSQVTVIPEGDEYEFMGWLKPGFDKFSVSRTFFSWLFPGKEYRLNANMHGGERALVVSGEYDKVLPMDILPEFLIKAILVEDIDKMEQLGIYEVTEEDLALCEFVCTSKLEIQKILRRGIELMIKELS
ncbi:Na(+)-translocating NADH-quinone reductase subunit A [Marinilabiliaceae bacterium ANBcel2]|nr:Na(+)-translocating NADH-quinone reductase subunit A [Marinilabiliaceae bacterium ANBcel2]